MLPELYLTNATDYFFTFLDGAGSQNHTAEACRQGGFWGVSANRTNHKLESHLGPATCSTAVMTHVASAGRDKLQLVWITELVHMQDLAIVLEI